MGPLGKTLRYLGLSGSPDSDRFAEHTTSRHEGRRESNGAVVGARLSFRGEVSGEGDFHIAGKFEGDINVTGRVLVSEGAEVDANISPSHRDRRHRARQPFGIDAGRDPPHGRAHRHAQDWQLHGG
jgi:hypothetical protein